MSRITKYTNLLVRRNQLLGYIYDYQAFIDKMEEETNEDKILETFKKSEIIVNDAEILGEMLILFTTERGKLRFLEETRFIPTSESDVDMLEGLFEDKYGFRRTIKKMKDPESVTKKRKIKAISDTESNERGTECKICFSNKIRIYFDCGHACVCKECLRKIEKDFLIECPLCGTTVREVSPIFL